MEPKHCIRYLTNHQKHDIGLSIISLAWGRPVTVTLSNEDSTITPTRSPGADFSTTGLCGLENPSLSLFYQALIAQDQPPSSRSARLSQDKTTMKSKHTTHKEMAQIWTVRHCCSTGILAYGMSYACHSWQCDAVAGYQRMTIQPNLSQCDP